MSKIAKIITAAIVLIGVGYFSFGHHEKASGNETLTVGIMSGDKRTDEQWDIIKKNAKKEGLDLKIKTFTDYTQPNAALTSGDIDANAFQHYIFLNDWNKTHKSDIVPVADTIAVAGRLYSNKHKSLDEIPNGGVVAISNTKITQGRTLLTLQAAGLIKVDSNVKDPTLKDITENPKNLQFKELGTDQLVRVLPEVDLASPDSSFIVGAGRSIKDAIWVRPLDKSQHDGVNIIATTKKKAKSDAIKKFIKAYQQKNVADYIDNKSGTGEVAVWDDPAFKK
ncbi:methionine ABC transporter substrate-binding protein [Fructobacillus sp. M2-14]|uniref:Methionine ABC transporter substrate-binding protein n=1 Tax=Fructobacillus broussonetiae TaxID=2713173 RepID=A0ABS5R0K9_9LACO|nr:MetQ/NlpA family ABC transporter substrate-binding protein [Fructobacillus broussonetiae]MBS9338161.1 methionine ABC transporter substrate-binding protein [Fructobacillus broussonetiae]